MNLTTFPYADTIRLGVAYAKLGWSQEMAAYAGSEIGKELKDLIRERKKGRTILARCDSEACVKIGQQLGITLFQGRYIDSLVRKAL